MKKIFILLLLSLAQQSYAQNTPEYKTYTNKFWGFEVDYPTHLLEQQNTQQVTQDGEAFKAKDNKASMKCFRTWIHITEDTPVGNIGPMENDLPDEKLDNIAFQNILNGYLFNQGELFQITYKVKKSNWFVVSGFVKEDMIFYSKWIKVSGFWFVCYLEYPKSQQKIYNPVCKRIFESFKKIP